MTVTEHYTTADGRTLADLTVVKVCRRCGSTDWDQQRLTCRGCGLTSYANSSKRMFKLAIHHRPSTFNRRKAFHGGQIKRSLSTL